MQMVLCRSDSRRRYLSNIKEIQMRKSELVMDVSDDELVQESPSLHTCSGSTADGFIWDGDEHEYESIDEFADPIEILMRREEAECRQLQLH